ncbi:MAG: DUF5688 family protein [Lachnospiraceae bacterium]|nr:DUF5688 family protein [Lachnospiraceae bacterium]
MNQKELESLLLDNLRERLGDECDINVISVLKNNNTRLRAIRFTRKDSIIHPTIYLERYYAMLKDGVSPEDICSTLYGDYMESVKENAPDLSFFTDYEKMREHIVCKLISVDRNEDILKDVPFVPFLDLAAVFYCNVNLSKGHQGSVLIRNNHFKTWNITVDELYKDALENNRKQLGTSARPIADVLTDLFTYLGKTAPEGEEPAVIPEDIQMYVLTNKNGLNGAACMLDRVFMEDFGNKLGGSYFILPSSVHELIVLPVCKDMEIGHLREMVKLINKTEVPREEVLSDEVYIYDYKRKVVAYA